MKGAGILLAALMILGQLTPAVRAVSTAYSDRYVTVEYVRLGKVYWVRISVELDGRRVLGWEGELPSLRKLPRIIGCYTVLARAERLNVCNFKAYKVRGRVHVVVDFTLKGYTVDVVLPRK